MFVSDSSKMSDDIKTVVIVGSARSGKTNLFNAMYTSYFRKPSLNQGTDFTAKLNVDGAPVSMTVFDTNSSESFFSIRRITYLTANLIIITFSLDNRQSLREVETKWFQEVKYFAPADAAYILVGTKKDLRDEGEQDADFIGYEEGFGLAKRLDISHYLECSSLSGEGVVEVFQNAAMTVTSKPKKVKAKKCDIL